MTFPEFQKKVKSKNLIDRIVNYSLCILATISGPLLFAFFLSSTTRSTYSTVFVLVLAAGLLSFGIFALRKLKKRYQLISIPSPRTITEKKKIVEEILEFLQVSKHFLNENAAFFTYSEGLFSSNFLVHLFFDDEQVVFSIRGEQLGFLDFGGTEQLRQSFRNELELKLLYH